MDSLTNAILSLDWWTERLAELTPGTADHTEALGRYEYWYTRASELQTRRDEQDHADMWLEFVS
jgi:hypothetical protein